MSKNTAPDRAAIQEERVIDAEWALDALNDAVGERGYDYVYAKPDLNQPHSSASCLYTHRVDTEDTLEPGCIVGLVLYNVGVPIEWLHCHEGRSASTITEQVSGDPDLNLRFTQDARYLLGEAQRYQDDGTNWGLAVKAARSWYEGVQYGRFNDVEANC